MESKEGTTHTLTVKDIRNILITQAKPESDKSPYFELEKKFDVGLDFQPLIRVVPIPSLEFRKQKIDIAAYSAVIFTSKNAIDNFFRTCEEMRINVSPDLKYFCITESIALYLQKFTLYRKRKVFYGEDGTNESLFDSIKKYKEQEKFLYPCSEAFDSEITNWLAANNCVYAIPVLYKVESVDISNLLNQKEYQVVCIFTPLSVKSFLESCPHIRDNGTIIASFGDNTRKAVVAAGLKPEIVAPNPNAKNMAAALELFLSSLPAK